jgi:hypothetical protein
MSCLPCGNDESTERKKGEGEVDNRGYWRTEQDGSVRQDVNVVVDLGGESAKTVVDEFVKVLNGLLV